MSGRALTDLLARAFLLVTFQTFLGLGIGIKSEARTFIRFVHIL
jgi:hypothetical protein